MKMRKCWFAVLLMVVCLMGHACAEVPGVAIPGWSKIVLPAHGDSVDAKMTNPAENAGWYYLRFELLTDVPDENGNPVQTCVLRTDLVPPGEECGVVPILTDLECGEYAGTLHVQPYFMNEECTPTNDIQISMKIVVVEVEP